MRRLNSFTLIELVVSVALLIIAISIALFAVVGSNGMIQKADARSSISESTRGVGDEIRRAVDNAPVGGISLLSNQGTTVAIQVKAFSDFQSGNTCTIIGRANAGTDASGEEKYTIIKDGTVIAVLIYNVDSGGLCPELTTSPIYQNRLTNAQAVVKDAQFSIQNMPCSELATGFGTTCITKQLLRYSLTLEMAQKGSGGTSEARKPTLTIQEGMSIGLINEATTSLKIDTVTLPDANANGPYVASVVASGGMPAYVWSKDDVQGEVWPPGSQWGIDQNTGVISGTPNSQQASGNTYPITIRVTDSDNPASFTTRALSIKVLDNLITISTASPLPNATEGSQYTQQLAATIRPSNGACGSCVWSLDSGTLPSGVTLDSTGKISGKPDAGSSGIYYPIIRAVESSSNPSNYITKAFQLTVSAGQTLAVTTASLPGGTVGVSYPPQTLQATGGTQPYTWAITVGTLPAGLSLAGGTGVVSGTPTNAGTSNFTVRVTDSVAATATKALSIVIASGGTLTITTTTLPLATVGVPYSASLSATGGTSPYTWSLAVGPLPPGLSLSLGGVISGTPSSPGTYGFTVRVTDQNLNTATKVLSITVGGGMEGPPPEP